MEEQMKIPENVSINTSKNFQLYSSIVFLKELSDKLKTEIGKDK